MKRFKRTTILCAAAALATLALAGPVQADGKKEAGFLDFFRGIPKDEISQYEIRAREREPVRIEAGMTRAEKLAVIREQRRCENDGGVEAFECISGLGGGPGEAGGR